MKWISLTLILFVFGCKTSDTIIITNIDFEDTLGYCNLDITNTTFFKKSNNEAVILTLSSGLLKNSSQKKSYTLSQTTKFIYRSFSDAVESTYFCNEVPPANPTVTNETEATGSLEIISTINESNDSIFHQLVLKDLLFENEGGKFIQDSLFFGSFNYKLPEESSN